ncbi:MAG: hypothetical protein Q7S65_06615 [Nanoarchaeota archaeon]|nr:hypothetical protein [Nanoarchaeota archaeon]
MYSKKAKRSVWILILLIIASNVLLRFRMVYGIDVILDLFDLLRGM